MTNPPTSTVTFLFTDIEGSTKLAREHPAAWETSRARHHAILREAIEGNNGYVFQIIGDAFCASFQIASDALKAALDAQRALQHETWDTPPIKVRMGLHTGTAHAEGIDTVSGGYVGYTTMALTQRVMSAAHGGQALLSQSTYDLARHELPTGITLRDMGEHQLKGLLNAEHLWQIVAPDLRQDFPALSTLNAIPHNLPEALTSFIGRKADITEVERLLSAHRLVTLTGPGGTGKTRLALEVAHRDLEKFKAGVWLAELAPIDREDSVASALAGAIGVQAQPPRSIADTIVDALQDRALLLIIDNCEHVLAGAAKLVTKILEHCPITKIITTSREPLHVSAEHLYPVSGLTLPAPTDAAEQLREVDAVRLLIERAAAVRPDFTFNANNSADVINICRSLDGLPLAIELAAARLRMMSPHEIAARLDQRFRLLVGGQRSDLPRHQTLRATIAWSYDLLTKAERTLFNRLSVFRGGCTLEAAEYVCAGDDLESDRVLDLITSLVDKSMVAADLSAEGTTRYRLLETLRQYGQERLIEANQENAICLRHAGYYTTVAEQLDAGYFGPHASSAREQWLTEEDNVYAALGWLANQNDGVQALRLGGAITWCAGWSHYRWREYADCLFSSWAKANELPSIYKVKVLMALGLCHEDIAEPERALSYYMESLDLARQLGNRLLTGEALWLLCRIERQLGHPDQLRVHAAECVEIGRDTNAVLLSASVYLRRYEPPDRRRALLEEFVAATLKSGSSNTGYAIQTLAILELENGNLQRASQLLEESYLHYQQRGDSGGPAAVSYLQGYIALLQGDYTRVMSLAERSRDWWRRTGYERWVYEPIQLLGMAAYYQGDYETAARRYQEGYDFCKRHSDRSALADILAWQVMLLRDRAEYQRANALCDESLAIFQQFDLQDEISWVLSIKASIAQRAGEIDRAIEIYRESLQHLQHSSDRITKVESFERLGTAFAEAKEHMNAARLLAFAEFQRDQMGIVLPPPDRPSHAAAIKVLREALDGESFAQAWQIGAALSMDEALIEAGAGRSASHAR